MALTNCSSCGGCVSTKAVQCPHCGLSDPTIFLPAAPVGPDSRLQVGEGISVTSNPSYGRPAEIEIPECSITRAPVSVVSRNGFRLIILATVVLAIVGGMLDATQAGSVPEPIREYFDRSSSHLIFIHRGMVELVWLGTLIGVFLFRPTARRLFLAATAVDLL